MKLCFKGNHTQTSTHLRGPPSSYGGMMTTLTVTEVLSRSIICSCVSVTAATLQISTNRLPCLRPACQAKPYSSTWMKNKTKTEHLCAAKNLQCLKIRSGHPTVPQLRCHPSERGSPAVPVHFFLASYPQFHIPPSTTTRTEGKKNHIRFTVLACYIWTNKLKIIIAK